MKVTLKLSVEYLTLAQWLIAKQAMITWPGRSRHVPSEWELGFLVEQALKRETESFIKCAEKNAGRRAADAKTKAARAKATRTRRKTGWVMPDIKPIPVKTPPLLTHLKQRISEEIKTR